MSIISLANAKEVLQIGHNRQDTILQMLIDGAEEWIAEYCGTAFVKASHTDVLDGGGFALWPDTRPVASLTSVTDLYVNTTEYAFLDGNQVLRADANGTPTSLRWMPGRSRYRVVYMGGHENVPAGLKMAILQLIYRAYHARGGPQFGMAAGASVSWKDLASGDIVTMLRPYKQGSPIF